MSKYLQFGGTTGMRWIAAFLAAAAGLATGAVVAQDRPGISQAPPQGQSVPQDREDEDSGAEGAAAETAPDPDSEDGENADAGAEADADSVPDLDDPADADLDEQTYESDDEGFIPTEEIPADEPIPFPSDI